ncbi:o-succinylbenzoate synthase [Flavobacteriales bacterium]|nr:o-succinylbenzoate synthase [Flavobacteriales bacterium]
MRGFDIRIVERTLQFKQPAGTSRGVLTDKPTFFVVAQDVDEDGRIGIGECSLIPGLSPESVPRAKMELKKLAASGTLDPKAMSLQYPAVRFAAETALIDLLNDGDRTLFPGPFTEGQPVPINGLIWMGDQDSMVHQAAALIERGFDTLKLKVGALDFEQELECLSAIRALAPSGEVTLRLDANGGLDCDDTTVTLRKLERLAAFDIHSMEQPVRPGQWKKMQTICSDSAIPIALDEELIGVHDTTLRRNMLHVIQPAFVILKPSLIGGLVEANHWIDLAAEVGAQWWATSALESNIGLNAIAQWAADATLEEATKIPQGLGTGSLFSENIPSPLVVEGGTLRMAQSGSGANPGPHTWDITSILS